MCRDVAAYNVIWIIWTRIITRGTWHRQTSVSRTLSAVQTDAVHVIVGAGAMPANSGERIRQ